MDILSLTASKLSPLIDRVVGSRFQRARGSLKPSTVFTTIMRMGVLGSTGYRQTLDTMKKDLGKELGWESTPSASSLSQARKKLSEKMCDAIYWATRNACPFLSQRAPHQFHEFRLHAIDMTRCNLPPSAELESYFDLPKGSGQKKRVPQATFTMIMDVGRNMPTSWILEDYKGSERVASYELCSYLGEGDLLIGDRGYPSRRFFSQLIDQQAAFLIRLRTSSNRGTLKEVTVFLNSEERESEIVLQRGPDDDGRPLRLRLMKKKLPQGDTAVFATNLLDTNTYTLTELTSLYCTRWRIETAFREMKMWHSFENMRAHSVLGIYQEITALMVFMLLAAELEMMAYDAYIEEIQNAQTTDEQHTAEPPIRFNRKQIAEQVVDIMLAGFRGPHVVKEAVAYALYTIWRYRQKVRRGRSFPRISQNPDGKWSSGRS